MRTSEQGIDFISAWEGRELKAYRDAVGIWTIGCGHIEGVKQGDTCTAAQAEAWLASDCKNAERAVNDLKVEMTQHQFDACVSLAFNIGNAGFERSTVAKKIKAGDRKGAAEAFKMWNKGGKPKKEIPGLTRRRAAESHLFLTGQYRGP